MSSLPVAKEEAHRLDANEDNKQPSDEELITRFAETLDENAFQEIVTRFYPQSLNIATGRIGNRESARDVVQQTFARIIKVRNTYDAEQSFAPWFYTILKNMCIDFQRKEIREKDKLRKFANTREQQPRKVHRDSSRELLESLTPHDREILTLRIIQGLSFTEIADFCDCTVEAAKKRAQRALKRLRDSVIS